MKRNLLIFGLAATLSMGAWTTVDGSQIEAPEVFNKNCAACHGRDGKGETRAGQRAKVKDFTDAEYQKTIKDEEAFKSIKFGRKDGDREVKKPFESKLSDEEIKALIKYVRTFAKE
jgi:mono/diheme cytochrome c family protein